MSSTKLVLLVENGVTLSKVTVAQGSSQAMRYVVESNRTPGEVRRFRTRLEALEHYETEVPHRHSVSPPL
jgi:hypothetical protein